MKTVPISKPSDRPAQPQYPGKPKKSAAGFADKLEAAMKQYVPAGWPPGTKSRNERR
ncbi:hypothetical protein [Sporomusa carbonis]|uniref:hypothetical protein n=1 Tax=Sporomusa carbonis TaxID=3076075 RepID=UPI003C7D5BFE